MPHFQVTMPNHDKDRSLGHLGAAWIEHFYRHGDGDLRGSAYVLEDDFYDFTVDVYALDENGKRLYKTAVLSRPKGTAKSEYAAAVDLFEALGPCRFAGWAAGGEVFEQHGFRYEYLPGEPMGKPVVDPVVRIMATEETQTGNTYGNVRAVLEDEGEDRSELADWFEENQNVFSGATGVRLGGGGKIQISTAGSKSKDGGKESHGTADETHLYTGALGDMYRTVKRNLNKRKAAEPWMLATTTMHQDGEDSIGEQQYKQALAIAAGKQKNPNFLFDHREGSPVDDLSDEAAVRASLREAYGGRDWIDYDGMLVDLSDGTERPEDFRRYFLNQAAGAATAFVHSHELDGCRPTVDNPLRPLTKGDAITLGFDFAPGTHGEGRKHGRKFRVPDATALVAVRVQDLAIFPIRVWEATEAEAMNGWNPPMGEIDLTVDHTFKTYKVIGFYADPTGVEGYLDKWTAKHLKSLKVKASTDRPTYRYMSGKSAARSGRDIDAFYEAIMQQQVRLSDDVTLTRHLLNARRAVGRYGTALFKKHRESAEKIDAAVAAVLAYAAAKDALSRGFGTEKRKVGIPTRIY